MHEILGNNSKLFLMLCDMTPNCTHIYVTLLLLLMFVGIIIPGTETKTDFVNLTIEIALKICFGTFDLSEK